MNTATDADEVNSEREALAKKATTPDGRLEYHLLEGESVTMYPYWASDLRTVIAGFRRSEVPEPQGEASDDYEAGYAEGFHHGLSTPRGSARDDRVDGEPSDAHAAEEADRRWPHTPGDPDTASARSARRLSFRQGVEWARAAEEAQ